MHHSNDNVCKDLKEATEPTLQISEREMCQAKGSGLGHPFRAVPGESVTFF